MNFRQELECIRQSKADDVVSKANSFLAETSQQLKELKTFRADSKLVIFYESVTLTIKIVEGSEIHSVQYANHAELVDVYNAICKKLTEDGCKYHSCDKPSEIFIDN